MFMFKKIKTFLKKNYMGGLSALLFTLCCGAYQLFLNPQYESVKRKHFGFLLYDRKYGVPNTRRDMTLSQIIKEDIKDERNTLEKKIAALIITYPKHINYCPGGLILTKKETRSANPFGKYSSYDPEKTQESVEEIINFCKKNNIRILIYDEGEGGYVPRVGTLPSQKDLADYLFRNKVGETLWQYDVKENDSYEERKKKVEYILEDYAQELSHRGIDAVLGPVLDVAQNNNSNIIDRDERSYSHKIDEIKTIAKMYIDAMKKYGIKVIVKHFPSTSLAKGDPHREDINNEYKITSLRNQINIYGEISPNVDGIMISNCGNPVERDDRTYSLSTRSYELIRSHSYPTKKRYEPALKENYNHYENNTGLNLQNIIVITDDLSMNAIENYLKKKGKNALTDRGKKLIEGCNSTQGIAAILAIDAGATMVIVEHPQEVIECLKSAYEKKDRYFKNKIDKSFEKWKEY